MKFFFPIGIFLLPPLDLDPATLMHKLLWQRSMLLFVFASS
jgi:hypothetical protein